MRKRVANITNRALSPIGLAVIAAAMLAACATPTPPGPGPVSSSYAVINSVSDCGRRDRAAPDVTSAAGQTAAIALAGECLARAPTGSVNPEAATYAFNAAQLYYAAGLYADRANAPAGGVDQFNLAIAAAERSQQLLADNDSSFLAGSAEQQQVNRRFRYERARVLAASNIKIGLNESRNGSTECGSRIDCLKAGISLIDAGAAGRGGLSSGFSRAEGYVLDGYRLQILRAEAIAELSKLGQPASLNTAVSDLGGVISALSSYNTGPEVQVAADARAMLISTSTEYASSLMDAPDPDPQRAIDFLEQATNSARPGGSSAALAPLYLKLGDAYLMKAHQVRAANPAVSATTEYCSAANAYSGAEQIAGNPADRTSALAGQGRSLTYLARANPTGSCVPGLMRGETDPRLAALDAYEAAKDNLNAQPDRTHYGTLARLYADLDRPESARALLDQVPDSDPTKSEIRVELARAIIPAWTASDSEVLAFCRNDKEGVLQYLEAAKGPANSSPVPYLEAGRVQYLCGESTQAETNLAAAIQLAKPEASWLGVRAEAFHIRSLAKLAEAYRASGAARLGLSQTAANLAEDALRNNSAEPSYRLQACRARLAGPVDYLRVGEERGHCSTHTTTNDGALLYALLELRKSKIDYTNSGRRSTTAFNSAEDALIEARNTFQRNAAAGASATFQWPGMSEPLRYSAVADYGFVLARACVPGAQAGAVVDPDGSIKRLLAAYNLSTCDYPRP